jgi:hypothetical protein
MHKDHFYGNIKSPPLRYLFRFPLVAIISHWLFQGILYMDPTERYFKLTLDLVMFVILYGCLSLIFNSLWMLFAAFLIAHTINFLFNGHLWGVLKHYGFIHHEEELFSLYRDKLFQRVQKEQSIKSIYICGSLIRNQYTPSSDLDIRLIRSPGFLNAMRICCFALLERSRAVLKKFPLDLYILDDTNEINISADYELIKFK